MMPAPEKRNEKAQSWIPTDAFGFCPQCGMYRPDLRGTAVKCTNCSLQYCSRRCRRKDRERHFVAGCKNLNITAKILGGNPAIPAVDEDPRWCCAKCNRRGIQTRVCGRCKKARYCCKECQRLDWKSHKPDCLRHRRGVNNGQLLQQQLQHLTRVIELQTDQGTVIRIRSTAGDSNEQ